MAELQKNQVYLLFGLCGLLVLTGSYIIISKSEIFNKPKIEIIDPTESSSKVMAATTSATLIVEIAGSVVNPGVYKLQPDSRVSDLLTQSGGLSSDADREFVEKNINRAAKVIDGQKVYIPKLGEQSNVLSASNEITNNQSPIIKININTSTVTELDKLPGIGQIYAQKIVEQRPYSDVEELVSKKVLSKSLLDKIKDKISIN